MTNVYTELHRDRVGLSVVHTVRTTRRGVCQHEQVTLMLSPEQARMLGIALIEDAAAADCYRREVGEGVSNG